MKPLVFHTGAEAELDAAVAYHESQRAGVGLAFQSAVEAALSRIQQNPQLYSIYKETNWRKCVLRKFPYTIFYLEHEECIWIGAVAHQRRKPGYWESRSPE